MEERALTGIKVIELATFVAAPCATRFFADQGADVIKIEAPSGDNLRYGAASEGRPDDPEENIVFDIENGNKRDLGLNLKKKDAYEALMKLLEEADIFITNWRPQALKKLNLDYESLKERFPKLVYGCITGYGDKGPDKDLPGYDATAFFARGGMLGTLYEKGTVPMNVIPGVGDRQAGISLAAGVLAALYKAKSTGKGEKVSVSLLATSIFMQATMIQSSQYGQLHYPIKKEETLNPLMTCYKTKDERFIQLALPVYDIFLKPFAKAMSHEEWITDERFCNAQVLHNGNIAFLYREISDCFSKLTVKEVSEILTKADLPFALAQLWDEVLEDPQAWATDCFCKLDYHTGSRTMVRNPVRFEEAGLPPYNKAPKIGQHTKEILKEIGYSDEKIEQMISDKEIVCAE